jgi:hypothetical protein
LYGPALHGAPRRASRYARRACRYAPLSPRISAEGLSNEPLRKALFQNVSEAVLVETGTSIDSQSLLDDIPRFVSSMIEIRKALSPSQRGLLKLPEGIPALLIAEATALRTLHAEHLDAAVQGAGSKAQRESESRRESREGIALRDLVYDALRSAVGAEGMSEIDAISGTAETSEALAKGLSSLADHVRRLQKAGGDKRLLLEEFGVDEACAATLEQKAVRVRKAGEAVAAPTKRVTQRKLDLQDGRVAHLIGVALRAFRAARRADASILVPELRKSAWLFEVRSGRARASKDAPSPPAPETSAASAPT